MPVGDIIKLRRGTAAAWTSANPTLAAGEPGFETDTGNVKIGTGAGVWTALSYVTSPALSGISSLSTSVSTSLSANASAITAVSTSLGNVSTSLTAVSSTLVNVSSVASAAQSGVTSVATSLSATDSTVSLVSTSLGNVSTSLSATNSVQTLLSTSESSTIARLTNVSTSTSTIQSTLTSGISVIGAVTSVNAIATVANGIPAEYAEAALTGQGAAIAATTIYAVPASGAGLYRVSFTAKVTRAATTSSTLGAFRVSYTDATDSVAVTTPNSATNTGNTTGAQISGVVVVHAKASTNIQYLMAYASSGATTMQYKLNVLVERI